MARNFAQEYKERMTGMKKKSKFSPIPVPKRTDFQDIDVFRQDLGFASPFNAGSLEDSTREKLQSSLQKSLNDEPSSSNFGLSDNTIKNIFRLGAGKITGSNFLKNVIPLDEFRNNAIENTDLIPDNLKSSLLSGLSLGDAIKEIGTNKALDASGLPEDIKSYIRNGLPEDQELRDSILPGLLAQLPISEKYKQDLMSGKSSKETAAGDLIDYFQIPDNILDLAKKDSRDIALDYFNDNTNLPVDISRRRDDSYLIEKDFDIGPGTFEIDSVVGGKRPGTSMNYNVSDYKISPSVTASLEARIDEQRRKNADLAFKYQRPGSNFSIDGRASFEEGRGPAFNIAGKYKF